MVLNEERCYESGRIRVKLIKYIPMARFSGILGTGQVEDWKIMRDRRINRWKQIVSGSKGNLVNMIKYAASKFHGYLILPKTRQILLHQG